MMEKPGIAMILECPISIDKDGASQPFPEYLTLIIPLNYDELALSRIIPGNTTESTI